MRAFIITLMSLQFISMIIGAVILPFKLSDGLILIIPNSIGLFLNIKTLDRL